MKVFRNLVFFNRFEESYDPDSTIPGPKKLRLTGKTNHYFNELHSSEIVGIMPLLTEEEKAEAKQFSHYALYEMLPNQGDDVLPSADNSPAGVHHYPAEKSIGRTPPELPHYKCHKEVHAAKILKVFMPETHTYLVLDINGVKVGITETKEYGEKHKPYAGGYYVVYEDGYTSFSPAEAFENGYKIVPLPHLRMMDVSRAYRKKPVIVEAVQFFPEYLEEKKDPNPTFGEYPILFDEKGAYLEIPTLEGVMRCDEGDWIITGIKGEKYPCKPDIFEATYEAIDNVKEPNSYIGTPKEATKDTKLDKSLIDFISEKVGEASMCWSDTPKGVFDGEKASKISASLIEVMSSAVRAKQIELENPHNRPLDYNPEEIKKLRAVADIISRIFSQSTFRIESPYERTVCGLLHDLELFPNTEDERIKRYPWEEYLEQYKDFRYQATE